MQPDVGPNAPETPVAKTSPARILVVDDERGVREGCRRALEAEGHTVDVAADARQGLRKIYRDSFDVILVDIKMPDINGLEMLIYIRRLDPDAVCVVITGYASYEMAVTATKRGAYDFLAKPFTPEELAIKVGRAYEHRQALVTARRAREEADSRLLELDAERGRLRTVVNCMVDGVLVANREGVLVLINPAARQMLSLNGSDPRGRPVHDVLPHGELTDVLTSALAESSRQVSVTSRELVIPPKLPGQSGKTLMANVGPVYDSRGEVLGAVAVLRDITEMRELDHAKSRFVSLVSHEIKAPLSAVQNYLYVLGSDMVDSPAERQEILQRSSARIEALLGLVNDLLDLTRIELGKPQRRLEVVDVAAVVRDVARLLEGEATARDVSIVDQLSATLPGISADRGELERAFTNLLSNGIKYNRTGGTVVMSAEVEGDWLRVSIADSGIGIAAEELPHIFEEFHRVRTPETRDIVGTGLGLAIAKRLIEQAHGRIEVRSQPGEGSVFSVLLPIQEEE